MALGDKWENLSRKQRSGAFIGVGIATILALILGIALNDTNGGSPTSEDSNSAFLSTCDQFEISAQPGVFNLEGIRCNQCSKFGENLFFSGCNNTCTSWSFDFVEGVYEVDAKSCDITALPSADPSPGDLFVCAEGYYTTEHDTSCSAETVQDFLDLAAQCELLGHSDTTLEQCYELCEKKATCAGIIVAENGTACFAFTQAVDRICHAPFEGVTACRRIPPEFVCFDEPVVYDAAVEACVEKEMKIVRRPNPDEFNIQLERIDVACNTTTGCWFESESNEHFFVKPEGGLNQAVSSSETHGYCCEIPTSAPTLSPTKSPTPRLFFVPECEINGTFGLLEMNQTEAENCCHQNGAELASIHSQAEQDFAWSVCEEALVVAGNDCGCWNGLNRIGRNPGSTKRTDFLWSDGSNSFDYENWEDVPLRQPNNLDNRNEECVHMRPFTDGGWNDLPCLGNCDAIDTKPFPLCRLPTPAPTTSPTAAPTTSPTKNPTTSPTQFPTTSPTISPTASPTDSPTTSPTKNPTKSPTHSPTTSPTDSPTKSPTDSPTQNPTTSPTKNPTNSPTKNPTTSPTHFPTYSPTKNPTTSPTHSPTDSPTKNPTTSPTKNPTDSPTKNPTTSPTKNPTTSPTNSPTDSPTKNPTTSPTKNPTTSPTNSPTTSPTQHPTGNPTSSPTTSPTGHPTTSPTKNPTTSPTKNPTDSPTKNPTTSPTKNPTTSPTKNPTTSPTKSPTTSPTKNPTTSPTKNPTNSPTKNPTTSPTKNPTTSPTDSPTKNPTSSPTKNPTKNPTSSPTDSPTKNPTTSPTHFPTVSPTQNPTTSPTKNPTTSPTKNPTTSPTKNPTTSPTSSPTTEKPSPVPQCTYDDGFTVWSLTNPNPFSLGFQFLFTNPNGNKLFDEYPGLWANCFTKTCASLSFDLAAGETIQFIAPGNTVFINYLDCADFPFCSVRYDASVDTQSCVCNVTVAFEDNFDSYTVGIDITDVTEPAFFDKWQAAEGTIDIIDESLTDGSPEACLEDSCLVIGGKLVNSVQLGVISGSDINIPPNDAFFDQICTLNLNARGHGLCQTDKVGCLKVTGTTGTVPTTFSLMQGTFTLGSNEGVVSTIQSNWGIIDALQGYLPYGLTTPVVDDLDNLTASLIVTNAVTVSASVWSSSPIIDDLELVCCCPGETDRYINSIIAVDQHKTADNLNVPAYKSNYNSIINYEPNYEDINVFALGIGGSITFQFNVGFTNYIYIYEQSELACCQTACHCGCSCGPSEDTEDAIVEVSVDGVVWFTVATSLSEYWAQLLPGGTDIRIAKVPLPNGACFQFLRITDNSDPDCLASDGFDLVAVEVVEPCCGPVVEQLPTVPPVGSTSNLASPSTGITAAAGVFFALTAVGLIALASMTVMTVQLQRRKQMAEEAGEKKLAIAEEGKTPEKAENMTAALASKEL